MRRAKILAILVCVWLAPGCGEAPQSNLPTTSMQIGRRTFTLEIAADDASQKRGLMRRDGMPDDHGMIFVFPGRQERKFWMHNTRFALDILFVDEDGRIVSIKRMEPYDEQPTPSDGLARYAIEINAGAAYDAGVKPGDILRIPSMGSGPSTGGGGSG